ncbi:hypothetical protein M514_05308 [Trichuris suis]|uniref:TFIIS N-terminal domain-containing protein n=1 Tax=Trichuris suis TaxID=68888 RepID=A0A085M9A6_9BILA|nr:hypothetical protein M513_05308 [Trichuris suis]KFD71595.1 hypothetical protein M514_05308 [Trichuris suis]
MAFEGSNKRISNGGLPAPATPPSSPESDDSSSSSVEILTLDCLSPRGVEENDSSNEDASKQLSSVGDGQELEDGLVLRYVHPRSPKTPPLFEDDSGSDSESVDSSDEEKQEAELEREASDNEEDSLEIVHHAHEIPGPRTPPTASDDFPVNEQPSVPVRKLSLSPVEHEPLSSSAPVVGESEPSAHVETFEQSASPEEPDQPFISQSCNAVESAEVEDEVRSPLESSSYQNLKTPESLDSAESLHGSSSSPSLAESTDQSSSVIPTTAAIAGSDVGSDREGSPVLLGHSAVKRVESSDSDTSEPSSEHSAPLVESSGSQEPSTSQEQGWKVQDEKLDDININELVDELNVSESEDSDDDIAQIFGENSEDEDRMYARSSGRASPSDSMYKDDVERDEETEQAKSAISHDADFVSDFDLMMAKRKAENRKRRWRRRNYDFINDSDDKINELITMMNKAAKADRLSNVQRIPALSKRKLLPKIIPLLKRTDWQSALIDLGVVTSIAEWLQLLPDKSLPAYEVRHELLKLLGQFPVLDPSVLRSSNIGKVVMLLYKHPKETKENKILAKNLFRDWLRPILNLQTDFSSLSREERMRRDYEHMPAAKKSRLKSIGEMEANISSVLSEKVPGPGDKDFIARARVPKPSTKDYVIRPKSNVDVDFSKKPTKKSSSLDRKIREIKDRLKSKKHLKAVSVSIEGRRLLH